VLFTPYIAPFLYCVSKLGLYLAYRADLFKISKLIKMEKEL